MSRLTNHERDERKWQATRNYLSAYANYKAAMKLHETFSDEVRAAWATLLQRQKEYKRASKL